MVSRQTGLLTFFDTNKPLLPDLQNTRVREANCCLKLYTVMVQSLARDKQRTSSCDDNPLSFYSRSQESNPGYKCCRVNSLHEIPKPLQNFTNSILTRLSGQEEITNVLHNYLPIHLQTGIIEMKIYLSFNFILLNEWITAQYDIQIKSNTLKAKQIKKLNAEF